jgi:hypothetical protein
MRWLINNKAEVEGLMGKAKQNNLKASEYLYNNSKTSTSVFST